MSKFGDELIESLTDALAHAEAASLLRGSTRSKCPTVRAIPPLVAHVAGTVRHGLSNPARHAKKLGAGQAASRRAGGGLPARDRATTQGHPRRFGSTAEVGGGCASLTAQNLTFFIVDTSGRCGQGVAL